MAYIISEDAQELLKDVHEFCENEVKEQAREYDITGEWPREIYEKAIEMQLHMMDVPEEYHYVTDQSIQSAEYAALTYENDAGNILALDYQYETENSSGSLSVFADEEDVQKVTVNGVSADLYVGEDEDSTSIIVWMDPETTALLSVTGDLPADELLALAQGALRVLKGEEKAQEYRRPRPEDNN